MSKKRLLVIIGLAIGLFPAMSFAAPSEVAIQELYQAAKAEGEVLWQVLGSTANFRPMAKAFEAKYPGIKVRTFSSRGSQMPARIITEAAAGKLSVDVGTCAGLDELLPLLERDLIASYDWTKISDLNPEDMLFDGRLIPHHDAPMVWVYNPTLVAKKDIPRSWDDLLDPMWKGSKISIRTNANNLAGLYPAWQKDPEKVIQYLGQLRKQEIMPAPGGVMGASRVATGETPIGVVRSVLVPVFERKGTPLPLSPIGPAVASPFAFYTPKAKGVPHPNAARLFIGWTHTKEGMAAFVKAGRGPGAPCDASTVAKLLCDNGIEFIRINKTIEGIKEFRKFVGEAAKAMGWK